jgi:hypothetical protein
LLFLAEPWSRGFVTPACRACDQVCCKSRMLAGDWFSALSRLVRLHLHLGSTPLDKPKWMIWGSSRCLFDEMSVSVISWSVSLQVAAGLKAAQAESPDGCGCSRWPKYSTGKTRSGELDAGRRLLSNLEPAGNAAGSLLEYRTAQCVGTRSSVRGDKHTSSH